MYDHEKASPLGRADILKLLERLRVENEEDAEKVLEALSKMSNENLIALMYFLYPEEMTPSVNEEVNKLIEALKEKGKRNFKVRREGNEITIEIL